MSENVYYLKSSEAVILRPMKLEDVSLIDAMHDRVSKDSMYYRYFSITKPPLVSLIEQARLSSTRGIAVVAVLQNHPQEIIGVAYYVCLPGNPQVAEPALLIEDRVQGQGLGWAMMECLIGEAQRNEIASFLCYVLPGNQRILKILEKSGLPMERHYRDGLFEISQMLRPGYAISSDSQHAPSNVRISSYL